MTTAGGDIEVMDRWRVGLEQREFLQKKFVVFEESFSVFRNFEDCKVLLECFPDQQKDFFDALDNSNYLRLKRYLKKNWLPQTFWDMYIFIQKFRILKNNAEVQKNQLVEKSECMTDDIQFINNVEWELFNKHDRVLYKDIIDDYEKVYWKINDIAAYRKFLEIGYMGLFELKLKEDLANGSVIKGNNGEIKVVDPSHSQVVAFYSLLKKLESKNIDLSGYAYLESSFIELGVLEEVVKPENNFSGKWAFDAGVGIIIEKGKYSQVKFKGGSIIYRDQIIDTSENPPVKFIQSFVRGYRLQSSALEFPRNLTDIREQEVLAVQIKWNLKELKGIDKNVRSFWVQRSYVSHANLGSRDVLDNLLVYYAKNKKIRDGIEGLDWDEDNFFKQESLRREILDFIDVSVHSLKVSQWDLEGENRQAQERLKVLKKKEEDSILHYKKILQEKDDKLREDLKLLDILWFTLMQQSFTDKFIHEINSVEWLRGVIDLWEGLHISEKINLSKWEFWNNSGENRKEVLVRWVNKAISWSPYEPTDVEGFVSWSIRSVWNKTKFLADLQSKYHIQNSNGTFSIERVRENLKRPISGFST
jgi:hypothetical protein